MRLPRRIRFFVYTSTGEFKESYPRTLNKAIKKGNRLGIGARVEVYHHAGRRKGMFERYELGTNGWQPA